MDIAAILRAGIFSPNHIANDAAILHAVASQLRQRGFSVNIYSEEEFCSHPGDEEVILSMARGEKTLALLQQLEDAGRIVVNSGYSVENCVRMIMVRLLADAGVAQPDFIVTDTDVDIRKQLKKNGFTSCWVKKGEAPIHHLEDICRCRHIEEAQEILHEFFFRKISRAVVSKYIAGESVRFYGVAGSGWFHCFMPFSPTDADEAIRQKVRATAMQAAAALKVDIFGGDIILTPEGECFIANFDDWPSFAPIRKEAAKEIAKSVMRTIRKTTTKRKRS